MSKANLTNRVYRKCKKTPFSDRETSLKKSIESNSHLIKLFGKDELKYALHSIVRGQLLNDESRNLLLDYLTYNNIIDSSVVDQKKLVDEILVLECDSNISLINNVINDEY